MKKSYLIITAIAAMLCMSACSTETKQETQASTETETIIAETETSAESETTIQETEIPAESETTLPETEIPVESETEAEDPLDYITVEVDEEDTQAPQDTLGLGADEYPTLFKLTTAENITDITLWRLDGVIEENGEFLAYESEFLGSSDFLNAGDSLTMSVDPGETVPIAGFSFIDEENVLHHYYLALSGEDGSAVIGSYDLR